MMLLNLFVVVAEMRCSSLVLLQGAEGALLRCKPFKYTYEKEIVM